MAEQDKHTIFTMTNGLAALDKIDRLKARKSRLIGVTLSKTLGGLKGLSIRMLIFVRSLLKAAVLTGMSVHGPRIEECVFFCY